MADPDRYEEPSVPETAKSTQAEHMEEEEKILAGRDDVNLPALLTKDVQGG